jgi:hypothetical protein
MTLGTMADIAGDNAAHLITFPSTARFITVCAIGGTMRLGDKANVAAARGVLCPQNVPVTVTVDDADTTDYFGNNQVGLYIPSGTTATITYGT